MKKSYDLMDDKKFVRENKIEKMAGFIMECINEIKYSPDDAYDMLLSSKQGKGILNADPLYIIHYTGAANAIYADMDNTKKYMKNNKEFKLTFREAEWLAGLIEIAHTQYGISYIDIFSKTSLTQLYKYMGSKTSDYEGKLIETYLI